MNNPTPPVRTLFGKPVRYTTLECWAHQLTLDEFASFMEGGAAGYVKNMKRYPCDWTNSPHYIEEWIEVWLAWNEIEEE